MQTSNSALAFCKTAKAADTMGESTCAAETASSSGNAPFVEKSTRTCPRSA